MSRIIFHTSKYSVLKKNINSIIGKSGNRIPFYKLFTILLIISSSHFKLSAHFDITNNHSVATPNIKSETTIKESERKSINLVCSMIFFQDYDFLVFENEEEDDLESNKKILNKHILLSFIFCNKTIQIKPIAQKTNHFNKYFSFTSSYRYIEYQVFRI